MMMLSQKYNVELPICKSVYNVLYRESDALNEINNLFLRSIKQEF